MAVIKRYPNRKLYNTDAKKYITLDGIAKLIRDGEEIQVLDHTSGEDLTTLTFSQIIFEQEKKRTGSMPRSVLTGLIRTSGERLDSLRRTLTTPLELLTPVEKEIDRRVQELIQQGELAREEGLRLRDKMLNFRLADLIPLEEDSAETADLTLVDADPTEPEAVSADPVNTTASAEQVQQLASQVEALTEKLNHLLAQQSSN